MQELYQSGVRTEHSYIDNIDYKDHKEGGYQQKWDQLKQILKWLHRKHQVTRLTQLSSHSETYHYFMIKIQSISNLIFKKCFQHSKVYATLIFTLKNYKTCQKYPKVTRIVKLLQETGTYSYELKEPILLYFYTSRQAQLILRMQILLSEQEAKTQTSTPIFRSCQSFGVLEIDFVKEKKGKEKKFIIVPNQLSLEREIAQNGLASTSFATYIVAKSENYKYLEKVICENTLCDASDRIAGVMGYFLPISENALTDFALTPDAQGLQLSFNNIQINSNLLKQAISNAEIIAKGKYDRLGKINVSINEVVMNVIFHNGWRSVSEGSSLMKQKGELQLKTNQSNLTQHYNNMNSRKNLNMKTNQMTRLKVANKKYFLENKIELKMTFPQEEQCVLIYQIVVALNVRGEYRSDKNDQILQHQQQLKLPICFAIMSAKCIANHKSLNCHMSRGNCLLQFTSLRRSIEQNLKEIALSKKNESKQMTRTKNKIPSMMMDLEGVSINNKTMKTLENLSQYSFKNNKVEIGQITVEMQLLQKNISVLDNNSLPIDNISSLQVSKIDVKDKIQYEKERINKESKKVILPKSNKLHIEFLKELVVSEQYTEQPYKPSSKNDFYAKEAFLNTLKQQIANYYNDFKPTHPKIPKNIIKQSPNLINQHYNQRVFYTLQVSKLFPESVTQQNYSKYLYLLYSNRIVNQNYYFKYESIPLDLLKTELSQIGYNNCYFFNFISISNHLNNTLVKLPKIFYFKIRFYKEMEVVSPLMTVNKDTGQVILLTGQQNSKIVHIEICINDNTDNFLLKFIQFIEYLYNGILMIEIIDYITGFPFGHFTTPLRSLIRKRRNQVIFLHEDSICYKGAVKANMKLQIRAIRKMRHKNMTVQASPNKSKLSPTKSKQQPQLKPEEQVDKRLDRILRFKQQRSKGNNKSELFDVNRESSKITKMVNNAVSHGNTKLCVCFLKKQFFFVELNNKEENAVILRMRIKDEDSDWIDNNPLSGENEITMIKDINKLQKDDYELLNISKKYQDKILKCIAVNEEDQIQIPPRSKSYLLMCYLTMRKYKEAPSQDQQLVIYNRQRTIICTFTNQMHGNIQFIHSIQIIPEPEQQAISLELYRPAQQQTLIHLPFLNYQFLQSKVDQLLVDDPFVLLMPAYNTSMPLIQRFTSSSHGIYLQLTNLANQQYTDFSVILLNDNKKKQQMMVGQSQKNERSKSRTKIQSRIVPEHLDESGPKIIRVNLRVWGCMKILVQVPLWGEKEGYFEVSNQIFKKGSKHFYVVADNEQSLKFWQDKKGKTQSHDIFKISQKEKQTVIFYSVFSNTPNRYYNNIHIIDAQEAYSQSQSIKDNTFRQIEPLYRLVMQVQTFVPTFKEMLKININRVSHGILQQPFNYRSSANKKTQFRVYSSDPKLVWVKNNDTVFQIESKADRKLLINFHNQKIIERYLLGGNCEGVVLGVKWQKGIDYFGFRFNIY